jgi:hypothetical protein
LFTNFENPVQVLSRGRVGLAQRRAETKCYECEGRGHFARECPTRIKRGQTRDSPGRKNPSERSSRPRSRSDESRYSRGGGDKMVSVHIERGSPAISVEIEGGTKRLIIDRSSNVTILQPGVSRCVIGATAIKPYGVTGENLDIQEQLCLVLGGKTFKHFFGVPPSNRSGWPVRGQFFGNSRRSNQF